MKTKLAIAMCTLCFITSCTPNILKQKSIPQFPLAQCCYFVDTIQIANPIFLEIVSYSDLVPITPTYVLSIDPSIRVEDLTTKYMESYLKDSVYYFSPYGLYPWERIYSNKGDGNLDIYMEKIPAFSGDEGLKEVGEIMIKGTKFTIYKPKIKYDGFMLYLQNISNYFNSVYMKNQSYFPPQVTYIPIVFPYSYDYK